MMKSSLHIKKNRPVPLILVLSDGEASDRVQFANYLNNELKKRQMYIIFALIRMVKIMMKLMKVMLILQKVIKVMLQLFHLMTIIMLKTLQINFVKFQNFHK